VYYSNLVQNNFIWRI